MNKKINLKKRVFFSSRILGFFSANAIAALILFFIQKKICYLPLNSKTDVIGYPIHQNFNINLIFYRYYYIPLLLPFLAIAIWLLPIFRTVFSHPKETKKTDFLIKKSVSLQNKKEKIYSRLKQITVGLTLSLIFINPSYPLSHSFYLQRVLIIGIYLLLVHLIAQPTQRIFLQKFSTSETLSFINSLFTPFTVLPLWIVSQSTRIIENGANGVSKIVSFPWIHPFFMGILLICVAAFSFTRIRLALRTHRVTEIETQLVLLIPLSILLFLIHSGNYGELGGLDLFHHGETLASAHLLAKGYFPWKNIFFIHGLLEDPIKSLIGMLHIQNTAWGALAAQGFYLDPLYSVLLYLFSIGLFGIHPLYPLTISFLLPFSLPKLFSHVHFRFILNPLVIFSFFLLIKDKKKWQVFLFSFFLIFQSIIAPESIFNIPSFGITLLCFEIYHWGKKKKMRDNLSLTLQTSIWCRWRPRRNSIG